MKKRNHHIRSKLKVYKENVERKRAIKKMLSPEEVEIMFYKEKSSRKYSLRGR